jgi:hypothetical protein
MFQACHASKEHPTEEDIHGCPKLCSTEIEGGILNPTSKFTYLDTNDCGNCLEDNKEEVEITID